MKTIDGDRDLLNVLREISKRLSNIEVALEERNSIEKVKTEVIIGELKQWINQKTSQM